MQSATATSNPTPLRNAFLLALGPAIAQGFARFAYALLLPAMRADMGWSYSTAGAMNTANAGGYLVGAILAPLCNSRWGERWTFLIGSWLSVLMLLVCGATATFPVLWGLRFASRLFGAWIFISGAALVSANTTAKSAAASISIYFAGVGIGIALTGITIPFYLATVGQQHWHGAWIGLGIASGVFSLAITLRVPFLRDATTRIATNQPKRQPLNWAIFRPLKIALVAYFLWGAGYITYMTFIIAYALREGADAGVAALLWSVLGVATVASPLLWKHPLQNWRGGLPMAAMVTVALIGSGLPLLSVSPLVMVVSALLLGASFMPVVAAITALTRRAVPPSNFSFAVAFLTVLFAAGQTVGPYLSGTLSDRYGLSAGLFGSVSILLGSAVLAFLQKPVEAATL